MAGEWLSVSEAARVLDTTGLFVYFHARRAVNTGDSPFEARYVEGSPEDYEVRLLPTTAKEVDKLLGRDGPGGEPDDVETADPVSSPPGAARSESTSITRYWSLLFAGPALAVVAILAVAYFVLGLYNGFLWPTNKNDLPGLLSLVSAGVFSLPGIFMLSAAAKLFGMWSESLGKVPSRQLGTAFAITLIVVLLSFGGETAFRLFGSWMPPSTGMRALWPTPRYEVAGPIIPIFGTYDPSLDDRRGEVREYVLSYIELYYDWGVELDRTNQEIADAGSRCEGDLDCAADVMSAFYGPLAETTRIWIGGLNGLPVPEDLDEFHRLLLLSAQTQRRAIDDAAKLADQDRNIEAIQTFLNGSLESINQAGIAVEEIIVALGALGEMDEEIDLFQRQLNTTFGR